MQKTMKNNNVKTKRTYSWLMFVFGVIGGIVLTYVFLSCANNNDFYKNVRWYNEISYTDIPFLDGDVKEVLTPFAAIVETRWNKEFVYIQEDKDSEPLYDGRRVFDGEQICEYNYGFPIYKSVPNVPVVVGTWTRAGKTLPVVKIKKADCSDFKDEVKREVEQNRLLNLVESEK